MVLDKKEDMSKNPIRGIPESIHMLGWTTTA